METSTLQTEVTNAATLLLDEGQVVSKAKIAVTLGIPIRKLSRIIADEMPALETPHGTISFAQHYQARRSECIVRQIEAAIAASISRDELVTVKSLARALSKSIKNMQKLLRDHRDTLGAFKVYNENEAAVYKTARSLIAKKCAATPLSIAKKMRCTSCNVYRVLRRNREITERLGIQIVDSLHLKRLSGFGVRRSHQRVVFPTHEDMPERILRATAARFVTSRKRLMMPTAQLPVNAAERRRIGHVRWLAIYLIRTDTGLEFARIGALLGGRSRENVELQYRSFMRKLRYMEAELTYIRDLCGILQPAD